MNYFVTVGGITIISGVSKAEAVKLAVKNNQSNTGIGYFKMRKGKKIYTLVPLYFYID